MFLIAVKGRLEIAHKSVPRLSWYADGWLNNPGGAPALIVRANYFPWTGLGGEVSYWYSRGEIHRPDNGPAVVCQWSNYLKACPALWFDNGVAHTPADIIEVSLRRPKNARVRLIMRSEGAVKAVLWKGMWAFADTFDCGGRDCGGQKHTSEIAARDHSATAHKSTCAARQNIGCQSLAEFGAHDTVKYDNCGMIGCANGPAVVRKGIKEWWADGWRQPVGCRLIIPSVYI